MVDNNNKEEALSLIDVEDALRIKDHFSKFKDVKSILIKGSDVHIPKVSICIPTYRRVQTLRDTIESCLAQTDFDDYLIIVSDNNPERGDETEQYISGLTDERVLYYKHELNIGMYGNLNRLYELSKSEYTVCIHDDDILLPHFLSVCFKVIENNSEIDFLYPDKIIWNSDLDKKPIEEISKKALLYKMSLWDFIGANPCPPTGIIIKTSTMRALGGYDFDTYPSNDYYFNVKALLQTDIYRLSVGLYIYRMGINTTIKKETILGFMRVDPPLIRWISNNNWFMKRLYSCIMLGYSLYWVDYFNSNHPNEPIFNVDRDITTHFSKLTHKIIVIFKKLLNQYKNIRHYVTGRIVSVSR